MSTKPKVEQVRVPIGLMRRIRNQLASMNCSAAHAASWVEPRTGTTTRLISIIDRVLAVAP